MKSYTTLRTDYGRDTLDASATNLTTGTVRMNDCIRRVCALGDFPFMHKDRTISTTASTQEYALPYDLDSVSTVKVTVGTTIYSPAPVNTQREWDILNSSTFTSDAVERYFVKDGEIALWPTPASSSSTVTLNGKLRVRDLDTADITSTTITTLANGGTSLTVSAGLQTRMVGFWIQPTFSTSGSTNIGDGNWYEMASIASTTTATLARKYGGQSISGGTAACTIGQMPVLPEAFHDLPLLDATHKYWAIAGNAMKTSVFDALRKERWAEFLSSYKTNINDPVVDDGNDGYDEYLINPNLYPTNVGT